MKRLSDFVQKTIAYCTGILGTNRSSIFCRNWNGCLATKGPPSPTQTRILRFFKISKQSDFALLNLVSRTILYIDLKDGKNLRRDRL